MNHKLTIFPFTENAYIKGRNGSYFKVNCEGKSLTYKVTHDSRRRVMEEACRKIDKRLREEGNVHFSKEAFVKCFSEWFMLLTSLSVYNFDKNYAKFENIFINDFNTLLKEFKNSTEFFKETNSGELKAIGTIFIEPEIKEVKPKAKSQKHSGDLKASDVLLEVTATTPEEYHKEQNQKPSGVIKAGKSRKVNFALKKGNVRIEFDSPPDAKDLDMLIAYLKYQLL